MAIPFTAFASSATIGSTARSLPADTTTGVPTSQTSKGVVTGFIDFSALAAGDVYKVQIYEKVSGGTQRLVDTWYVSGVQAGLWPVPELTLSEGWDIVVSKESGTDRSIRWALKQNQGDTSSLLAEPLTGYSVGRLLKLIAAATAGKSTVSGTSRTYRQVDDSGDAITGTEDSTGQRSAVTHGA
jgi:hypothetical protein